MTAKLVEALAQILEKLNETESLEEVNKLLSVNGNFDDQILGIAFSLIHDKILRSKKNRKSKSVQKNVKFRILDEDEKEILGLDNYNYILHLQNVGLLDSVDFELLLEQILLIPQDKITKDDINFIILLSIIDFEVDILPGSRVLLYSSDTIN